MKSTSTRSLRRQAKRQAPPRAAEEQYVRFVKGVVRGLHQAVLPVLLAAQKRRLGLRQDGITRHGLDLGKIKVHFLKQVPKVVQPGYDAMAKKVVTKNAATMKSLIGIHPTGNLPGLVSQIRQENVSLITNASEDFLDDVLDVFDDPDNAELSVEELADLLEDRVGVSESRAALIARDQTLKLNARLTAARQQSAGVEEYIWSTSLDQRVREEHQEREGKRFSWNDPPEDGHPGEPINCRCVAIPVVEELDDIFGSHEAEDEEDAEDAEED